MVGIMIRQYHYDNLVIKCVTTNDQAYSNGNQTTGLHKGKHLSITYIIYKLVKLLTVAKRSTNIYCTVKGDHEYDISYCWIRLTQTCEARSIQLNQRGLS